MNPMLRLVADALQADVAASVDIARQTSGCRKRRFGGPGDARRAHRHASYRIRVYACDDCGGWHVTNNEKRHRAEGRDER